MSLPSSRRSRLLFWNLLGAAGVSWLLACGPSLSQLPLFNALPEGPGEYLYGPQQLPRSGHERPGAGGNELAGAQGKRAGSEAKGPAGSSRKKPHDKEDPGSFPGAAASASASASPDAGVDVPAKVALAIAGDYRGTDRVTIRLGGETATEEVDPNARVRVEASEDSDGDYIVSVLDSNTGDTLCGLTGTAEGTSIHFEPNQPCFEGTLGIDASTSLKNGEALVSGSQLTVTFEIALLAFDDDSDDGDGDDDDSDDGENTAADSIEVGTVKYRFDGKRP